MTLLRQTFRIDIPEPCNCDFASQTITHPHAKKLYRVSLPCAMSNYVNSAVDARKASMERIRSRRRRAAFDLYYDLDEGNGRFDDQLLDFRTSRC